MANREALRELQGRLADRLQAPRGDRAQAAWLAVEAGGARYLLPLAQAGEISAFQAPQAVPYTRPWFLGVANLRGGLWGVADLAAFVAGEPPRAEPADRTQARLVALGAVLEVNCALRIDRLAGLRGIDAFRASASRAESDPAWFGSRYTDAQGQAWQELNLQALARDPAFLDIAEDPAPTPAATPDTRT
ncbi:chemotaxis protein CheW [Ramlibacter sp. MAHUQ-53]|uniref:chemotaxis protein CheW n=1 Tax=unclassified Ramlibacter TaxID=2617605 RepID=UPI00363F7AC0